MSRQRRQAHRIVGRRLLTRSLWTCCRGRTGAGADDPSPRVRVLPLAKTGPRRPARAVEPAPLPIVDPASEVELPAAGPSGFDQLARRRQVERATTMFRTHSGGILVLSGLPLHEQRQLYGQVALQVSALGQTPESRQGVTLPGARLLAVSMRSPADLARDWGEVFSLIVRALGHGVCVVVHCMVGRRRAALLTCAALALLPGASLEATETWMLTRRGAVKRPPVVGLGQSSRPWNPYAHPVPCSNRVYRDREFALAPAAAGWNHPMPPCPGTSSCIKSPSQCLLHQ